eukprot:m.438616 g.438616  ORF g.438616 m.438616 type:complete len:72 (-) comp18264_c0_seq1:4042-4257(-)
MSEPRSTAKLEAEIEQLKAEADIPREKVSVAAQSIKQYCNSNKDYMIPSVWGKEPAQANKFKGKAGQCYIL